MPGETNAQTQRHPRASRNAKRGGLSGRRRRTGECIHSSLLSVVVLLEQKKRFKTGWMTDPVSRNSTGTTLETRNSVPTLVFLKRHQHRLCLLAKLVTLLCFSARHRAHTQTHRQSRSCDVAARLGARWVTPRSAQVSRSKPSARISQLTWTVVMGKSATPQIVHGQARAERPHAELIRSRLIHGRRALWRMGPVAASPVLHKQQRRSLRTASKTKRLCGMTAAHFDRHKLLGARFVLGGATRAVAMRQVVPKQTKSLHLGRQLFTRKHRSSQQREDCAERS